MSPHTDDYWCENKANSVPALLGRWLTAGAEGVGSTPKDGEQLVVTSAEIAVQRVTLRVIPSSQCDLCTEGRNHAEQGHVQTIRVVHLLPPDKLRSYAVAEARSDPLRTVGRG
jgi:hypothetical protein